MLFSGHSEKEEIFQQEGGFGDQILDEQNPLGQGIRLKGPISGSRKEIATFLRE